MGGYSARPGVRDLFVSLYLSVLGEVFSVNDVVQAEFRVVV
jgi:hypothetical protein